MGDEPSLAERYFRLFIVPILTSESEFESVVYQNRSSLKIRVIGRDQPMEAKRLRSGDSEIIQVVRLIARLDSGGGVEELMLIFKNAVQKRLEPSSLKILLEDFANEWKTFRKSRQVRELFK